MIIVPELSACIPFEQRVELTVGSGHPNVGWPEIPKDIGVQLIEVFLMNVLDDFNEGDKIEFMFLESWVLD